MASRDWLWQEALSVLQMPSGAFRKVRGELDVGGAHYGGGLGFHALQNQTTTRPFNVVFEVDQQQGCPPCAARIEDPLRPQPSDAYNCGDFTSKKARTHRLCQRMIVTAGRNVRRGEQVRARQYCAQTGARLVPFGADMPEAISAIAAAARATGLKPDEVWCASGSGVLLQLHGITRAGMLYRLVGR
jgi:hypothetical protein